MKLFLCLFLILINSATCSGNQDDGKNDYLVFGIPQRWLDNGRNELSFFNETKCLKECKKKYEELGSFLTSVSSEAANYSEDLKAFYGLIGKIKKIYLTNESWRQKRCNGHSVAERSYSSAREFYEDLSKRSSIIKESLKLEKFTAKGGEKLVKISAAGCIGGWSTAFVGAFVAPPLAPVGAAVFLVSWCTGVAKGVADALEEPYYDVNYRHVDGYNCDNTYDCEQSGNKIRFLWVLEVLTLYAERFELNKKMEILSCKKTEQEKERDEAQEGVEEVNENALERKEKDLNNKKQKVESRLEELSVCYQG